ncbi:MAG: winged helix-turn-helix domain-containing protein [Deltaproteobacteria bacterium]|nr:winged helix-turn-helix domain-containing protein [Deltaproteobacteria bacterium]
MATSSTEGDVDETAASSGLAADRRIRRTRSGLDTKASRIDDHLVAIPSLSPNPVSPSLIIIRNQDGASQKRWGGRRRCSMTLEQEKAFLAQWEQKATAGGVLSVLPIHAALVERLGHDTPMSTTYRLLARHGWRKVQPDTKHPKSDPAKQAEFKKKSLKLWLPPA